MSTISDKINEIYSIKCGIKEAIEASGKVWEDTKSTDAGKALSTYPSKINMISQSARPTSKITYALGNGIRNLSPKTNVVTGYPLRVEFECDEWYSLDSVSYKMGSGDSVAVPITDNKVDAYIDSVSGDTVITGVSSYFGPIPCTRVNIEVSEGEISPREQWTVRYNIEPEGCTDDVLFESSNEGIAVVDENGVVSWVSEGNADIYVKCGSKSGTLHMTCKEPEIDCTGIELKVNGVDYDMFCVDLLTGNTVNLKVELTPPNTDCPLYWTISNKLPEDEYDDMEYVMYTSMTDGTLRVPYAGYDTKTSGYTYGKTTAWTYKVNDDVTLNTPSLVCEEEVKMFDGITIDPTDETKASFNILFDGRCVVTARCGKKYVSKTLSFYPKLSGGKGIGRSAIRKIGGSPSATAGDAIRGFALGTQQRAILNPLIHPMKIGDTIEIECKNIGATAENMKFGFSGWSSTYKDAGNTNVRMDRFDVKELLQYSCLCQCAPVYLHFDALFDTDARFTKYMPIYSSDGLTTWYKVSKTNEVDAEGKPLYSDISESISATTQTGPITYHDKSYGLRVGFSMFDDYWSLCLASGSGNTYKIGTKSYQFFSTEALNAVGENFIIRQNGTIIYGDKDYIHPLVYKDGWDGDITPIQVGSDAEYTITIAEGSELKRMRIFVDGVDVTEDAWDEETHTISLKRVELSVVIDISYKNVYACIYGDGGDINTITMDGYDITTEVPFEVTDPDDTKLEWINRNI